MSKPTLLQKGKLVPNNPKDVKMAKKLAEYIPMDYIMEWFRDKISSNATGIKNRVLILLSETGSGKSTALPPTLYSNFYAKGRGDIIVSQPRVLTAMTIPIDITSSKVNGVPIYPDMKLGLTIGWQTGPSRRKPTFGVTYATIGVLTQQLKVMTDTDFMKKYRFIILDEVHEMSLELSSAMYMLKNFMSRNADNPNLPFVVATSATFIPEKFLKYFGVYDEEHDQPNLIKVTGFAYERVPHWMPYATNNYIQSAVEVALKIHADNPDDDPKQADILIFLPSPGEMKQVSDYLEDANRDFAAKGKKVFMVLQIDRPTINENKPDYAKVFMPPDQLRVMIDVSKKSSKKLWTEKPKSLHDNFTSYRKKHSGDYEQVELRSVIYRDRFEPSIAEQSSTYDGSAEDDSADENITKDNNGDIAERSSTARAPNEVLMMIPQRRIILSTSVAETGLTIDTLKYCIDSGYHRGTEFNPNHNINALLNKPAPQSRIRQRWGRIGRKFPGHFYPLYPEYIYNMLPVNQFPDLVINDISPIFMSIISEQIKMKDFLKQSNEFLLEDIDLVDFPSQDALASALERVYVLGFINIIDNSSKDTSLKYTITDLGKFAAQFSFLLPEQIRMILSSYAWGANTLDMITIAAYLSMKASEFKLNPSIPIKWPNIYNDGLPSYWGGNETSAKIIYKTRLLIADEFIDGLILFNAIMNVIKSSSPENAIISLGKWCRENNILYSSVMNMLRLRDEIIEQVLNAGLKILLPNSSLSESSEEQFMNTIVRIKHCIYDGFLLDICELDDKTGQYKTSTGLIISTPDLFTRDEYKLADEQKYGISIKSKPKHIIVDRRDLAYNYKTKIYNVKSGRCSVLDGFIPLDIKRLI